MKYNPKAKLKPKQVTDIRKQTRAKAIDQTIRDATGRGLGLNTGHFSMREPDTYQGVTDDYSAVIAPGAAPKRRELQPVGPPVRAVIIDKPATPRHIERTRPDDRANHGISETAVPHPHSMAEYRSRVAKGQIPAPEGRSARMKRHGRTGDYGGRH